jgi:hypothetical protein
MNNPKEKARGICHAPSIFCKLLPFIKDEWRFTIITEPRKRLDDIDQTNEYSGKKANDTWFLSEQRNGRRKETSQDRSEEEKNHGKQQDSCS